MHAALLIPLRVEDSFNQILFLLNEILECASVSQMFQAACAEAIVRSLVVASLHVLNTSFCILFNSLDVLRGKPATLYLGIGVAMKTQPFLDEDGFGKSYFLAVPRTKTCGVLNMMRPART